MLIKLLEVLGAGDILFISYLVRSGHLHILTVCLPGVLACLFMTSYMRIWPLWDCCSPLCSWCGDMHRFCQ